MLNLRHVERGTSLHAQQYARRQVLDARQRSAHVGGRSQDGHRVIVLEAGLRALDGFNNRILGFGDAHEQFGELGIVHVLSPLVQVEGYDTAIRAPHAGRDTR